MTSLDYYRELLDEIQLRVNVDGPTRVGHSQPFGVFVSLETTQPVAARKRRLQQVSAEPASQTAGEDGRSGRGRHQNLRDDFTKNIHAALDETFEVISVTFHDAAVKTIDLPRDGWVETPMIYPCCGRRTPRWTAFHRSRSTWISSINRDRSCCR